MSCGLLEIKGQPQVSVCMCVCVRVRSDGWGQGITWSTHTVNDIINTRTTHVKLLLIQRGEYEFCMCLLLSYLLLYDIQS